MKSIQAADRGELYPVSSELTVRTLGSAEGHQRDVGVKVEMRGQSDVCSVPAGAASEGSVFHHRDLWPL